jgi:hypothetical protein
MSDIIDARATLGRTHSPRAKSVVAACQRLYTRHALILNSQCQKSLPKPLQFPIFALIDFNIRIERSRDLTVVTAWGILSCQH